MIFNAGVPGKLAEVPRTIKFERERENIQGFTGEYVSKAKKFNH
jgi:hypothetical protein